MTFEQVVLLLTLLGGAIYITFQITWTVSHSDDKKKKCETDDEKDEDSDDNDNIDNDNNKDEKLEEHTKCSYFYVLKQKFEKKEADNNGDIK